MQKVKHVVWANLADPDFNVYRLAKDTSVSERQLYRYIKQTSGLTPGNFIKEVRLQKAFDLARNQAYETTSELAYAVGFTHSGYFTSVFRKRFGKNPSEMLKES